MPITASEGSAAFAAARPDLDDLIKRRFFYRQAFEIYGGVAGFYTYGPPGAAVKQNLIDLWRKHFVIEENLLEVDDCNIMPYDVLATSGHVERFNDFIVKDSLDPNKFYRAAACSKRPLGSAPARLLRLLRARLAALCSQGEAGPLGAQPLPRVLEPQPSPKPPISPPLTIPPLTIQVRTSCSRT